MQTLLNRYLLLIITSLVACFSWADTIELAPVNAVTVPQRLVVDGTVEAIHQTTLTAQTSGQIKQIFVEAGDRVEKGHRLIQLKDDNQQAAFATAKANLAAAQAAFDEAAKTLKRVEGLRAKKLASQQDFDDASARFDITKAQLAAAKAQLDAAKEQLSYTQIIAPYSGIVLERHVSLGEVVSPGSPLFTGTSLSALRVMTQIPQADAPSIKQFSDALIQWDNQSLTVSPEQLHFYAYALANNGAIKTRIDLPSTTSFYPGQLVKVAFTVAQSPQLLIDPRAVIKKDELRLVYVKDDKDQYHLRQIRLGRLVAENQQQVLAGLTENEHIVLNPSALLRELSQ
jgi:RND family efflux transporter MFP subunit